MKYSWQLYLAIILSIALFSLLSLNVALADESHNIRGLASSSKGYISFNCLDDDFFGRFTHTFAFYFHVPPCSVSQHGVNLEANNNLSGQAWSPSLGFIDFGSASTPTLASTEYDKFVSDCMPGNHCTSANDCIACYNENSQRIYGFAYSIKEGKWIRLDDGSQPNLVMSNYNSAPPGVFEGITAASNTSFGPISFNCKSDNTCGIDNYKVYMWKLALHSMSAPNWSMAEACKGTANQANFRWILKSGQQKSYRIIINNVNSTSSPLMDTGRIYSSTARQLICPSLDCKLFIPDFKTSYYWWLQLWDEEDNPTELIQFNADTFGIADLNNWQYNKDYSPNPKLTFTTYRHAFPHPLFYYSPADIYVGTSTQFTSDSTFYTDAQPNSNPQTCVDGNCSFLWTASLPLQAIISSSTMASTEIVFKNTFTQKINLEVRDPHGYTCSYSQTFSNINFQLPLWKEVKAK